MRASGHLFFMSSGVSRSKPGALLFFNYLTVDITSRLLTNCKLVGKSSNFPLLRLVKFLLKWAVRDSMSLCFFGGGLFAWNFSWLQEMLGHCILHQPFLDIHHMNIPIANLNDFFLKCFHLSYGPSLNHRWPMMGAMGSPWLMMGPWECHNHHWTALVSENG